MMMGGMWLWMLFWLLLAVAGIVLIVWAISRGRGGDRNSSQQQDDRAQAILRERFAAGEMSESEYHERRRILENNQR